MTTTANSIYMRVKGQRPVENHAQVRYARDLFKFIIVNVVLILDKSLSSRKGHHIALVDIQRHVILQTPLMNYRHKHFSKTLASSCVLMILKIFKSSAYNENSQSLSRIVRSFTNSKKSSGPR